jgi:hypothetical protein
MGSRKKNQLVVSQHVHLIEQAVGAVAERDYGGSRSELSSGEIAIITRIIEEINPSPGAESILAVQVAVAQMIGLYELGDTCPDSKRLGLLLIRHACDALQFIDRSRQRNMQVMAIDAN